MVSIKDNKLWWDSHYDWAEAGDEWSLPWGSAEAQWYGSILPRIHRFLPAGEAVEIASGFGRWTQFLKEHCDHLTGFDLAENCVTACQQRFAGDDRVAFVTNDGATLPGIADRSVDFAFSFDSLVHVDQATIAAYLAELSRVLKPTGVAFIHHSNLGALTGVGQRLNRVRKVGGVLRRLHVTEYTHMRDATVSAEFVAAEAERAGLACIAQEVTPWLTRRTLIDCMSVIVPADSPAARPNQVVVNKNFSREPEYIARLAPIYTETPS